MRLKEIGLLLIDRGDRPKLTAWVRERLAPQGTLIESGNIMTGMTDTDIVPRVIRMMHEVKNKYSFECIYLIENDDYYPTDYIERMEKARGKADFIASDVMVM